MLALLLPLAARAATLDVCATCAYPTIGAAVAAANPGDTIRIAAGVYDESDTIVVSHRLRIMGAGSDATIVRGTADPLLLLGLSHDQHDAGQAEPAISISGLDVDVSTGDGIAIVYADVDLTDIRAAGIAGTAISVGDSTLDIASSNFLDNEIAVGVYNSLWGESKVSISDSTFSGHTSSAVWAGDTELSVTSSVFEANGGTYGAAVMVSDHRGLDLFENTFSNNSAPTGFGGAIWFHSSAHHASIEANLFCHNTADTGGAIVAAAPLVATGNVFVGNRAASTGGAVHLSGGAMEFTDNTFVGGYAPVGGSLWSESGVSFVDNIVAYTSEYGLYGAGGTAVVAYNDFWEVAPDAVGGVWPPPDSSNLFVDPMFPYYVAEGCQELDLETRRWYRDADGDGHGIPDYAVYDPTQPAGYAATDGDCDDTNADRRPGVDEHCDGIDENCDGVIDNAAVDAPNWRRDQDADGYQGTYQKSECEQPAGWDTPAAGETDCDDEDATVYPGAPETCGDGADQDCDDADAECGDTDPPSDTDVGDTAGAVAGACQGCNSASHPTWALLLLAGAIKRTRARQTNP